MDPQNSVFFNFYTAVPLRKTGKQDLLGAASEDPDLLSAKPGGHETMSYFVLRYFPVFTLYF